MKNFSKLVFTALFVLAVAPAFSQFSLGADLALPSGNWSTYYNAGFGVSGRYEAPIQDKLNWTATAGFLSFSLKSTYGSASATIIPIAGGIKYYFQEANSGFYVAADLGIYFTSVSAGGTTVSDNKFGLAPGVGYRVNTWDFTFRLNTPADGNYLGLRAAYVFGSK